MRRLGRFRKLRFAFAGVRVARGRRAGVVRRLLPLSLVAFVMAGCLHFSYGPSGPPPALHIAQVKDLGPIPTNPDILGRDGGYSAVFQGYSVWVYGDTFLAKADAEDRTLLSDSWSFTTDLNAQAGITGFHERLDPTGAPTMILPETPAEQAFNQAHNVNNCQEQPCGARWALWPSSIVVNPADNSALIFYMVVSARPGAFNFQGIGTSVALWQNFQQQPQRPTLNPPIVPDHPDLMFTESEPEFGTAALISDGTLYVYGCGILTNSFDLGCRLARVDPSSAQDRSKWTFYAGNGNWSSNVGDAIPVFGGRRERFVEQLPAAIHRGIQPGFFAERVDPHVAPAGRSVVGRYRCVRGNVPERRWQRVRRARTRGIRRQRRTNDLRFLFALDSGSLFERGPAGSGNAAKELTEGLCKCRK